MKPKLFLTVLALVIVPTALLSLMASRALRDRELVLESQLKTRADDAIQAASRRISTRLNDELDHVRVALNECLSRGGKYHDVGSAVSRLKSSRSLVRESYLFMNPWGLMYPQGERRGAPVVRGQRSEVKRRESLVITPHPDPLPEGEGMDGTGVLSHRERMGGEGRNNLYSYTPSSIRPGWDFIPGEKWKGGNGELVSSLRNVIADTGPGRGPVMFRAGDDSFLFSPLQARRTLYAGYCVDIKGFTKILSEAVAALSGDEFVLSSRGADDGKKVIVTDSFGRESKLIDENRDEKASAVLSVGRLGPPFDHITVTALAMDPGRTARAGKLQSRLFAWSILLMATGICAGVWIVFRESAEELRRARARTDFVIGVSHDLRTPVSSMKMLSESLYLDRVPDKKKQKQFLGTITKECDRLADMIERVLFFMREEHGASVYKFEKMEVGPLVTEVARSFVERRHGSVDVALDVSENLPEVDADGDALSKVMFNLMDNAVKYSVAGGQRTDARRRTTDDPASPGLRGAGGGRRSEGMPITPHPNPLPEGEGMDMPGSPRGEEKSGVLSLRERVGGEGGVGNQVRIEIQVNEVEQRGRQWIRIAVRDFGIGIEARELKRVFRKFYRASLESEGKVGGIGLGLALCKSIVRSHNGRIEAESNPGKGSVFTIYLPVAKG